MVYKLLMVLSIFTFLNLNYASANEESQKEKLKYFTPLTEEEKKSIEFMIATITTKSTMGVMANQGKLEAAGNKINNVNPIRFWKEVFTNKSLRSGLPNVALLVKSRFINKAVPKWEKADQLGQLKKEYFEDFSKASGLPLDKIDEYVDAKNWKGLLQYFFQQS